MIDIFSSILYPYFHYSHTRITRQTNNSAMVQTRNVIIVNLNNTSLHVEPMMNAKLAILLLVPLCICGSVNMYSSFWAPLFDPKILNYRVDATFDHEAGKAAREGYAKDYGFRGEKLIADLGNGGVENHGKQNKVYEDVKFYYT